MDSFIFSLEATVPIFLVIVLGYVLMRVGFFTKEFTKIADKYVFKVALPVLLFKQIATADIHEEFDWRFVVFCMAATTLMFMVTWALAKLFLPDKDSVGSFAMCSVRGSAAILGIAFIENIYGSSGMGPLMIVSSVPLYNIYSVIILTVEAKSRRHPETVQTTETTTPKQANVITASLLGILKNPIIIGIFAGLPFAIIGIPIPTIPLKALTSVANTATPVALLVVGAGFEGGKALKKIGPTVVATMIKLVIVPAVFLPIALWLGFRNEALVAIIIMLAAPTTVTTYIMSKNMDNDEVLASSIVVLATLLSSVTLTLWIFLMRSHGWI